MTVLATKAEPGKIYRLTRDSGTTYYRICDAGSVGRLTRRLEKLEPRTMKPTDLRTWQALLLCRGTRTHVLGVRILRFRDDGGAPRESRAYVAFPADYVLREVEKPPGYAGGPKTPSTEASGRRKIRRKGARGDVA